MARKAVEQDFNLVTDRCSGCTFERLNADTGNRVCKAYDWPESHWRGEETCVLFTGHVEGRK